MKDAPAYQKRDEALTAKEAKRHEKEKEKEVIESSQLIQSRCGRIEHVADPLGCRVLVNLNGIDPKRRRRGSTRQTTQSQATASRLARVAETAASFGKSIEVAVQLTSTDLLRSFLRRRCLT